MLYGNYDINVASSLVTDCRDSKVLLPGTCHVKSWYGQGSTFCYDLDTDEWIEISAGIINTGAPPTVANRWKREPPLDKKTLEAMRKQNEEAVAKTRAKKYVPRPLKAPKKADSKKANTDDKETDQKSSKPNSPDPKKGTNEESKSSPDNAKDKQADAAGKPKEDPADEDDNASESDDFVPRLSVGPLEIDDGEDDVEEGDPDEVVAHTDESQPIAKEDDAPKKAAPFDFGLFIPNVDKNTVLKGQDPVVADGASLAKELKADDQRPVSHEDAKASAEPATGQQPIQAAPAKADDKAQEPGMPVNPSDGPQPQPANTAQKPVQQQAVEPSAQSSEPSDVR
jgi:hypothetical protein